MLASLVRKDFLLLKKHMAVLVAISVLAPLLMVVMNGGSDPVPGMGALVFLYMAVLVELYFSQVAAAEEEKSPKAVALLCAAPYPRKSYVVAKYACHPILFACCFVVYSAMAALFPQLDYLTVTGVLVVFLAASVLHGIYTPAALRFGAARASLVFVVAILALSLGPTLVVNLIDLDVESLLAALQGTPPAAAVAMLAAAGVGFSAASMMLSARIFAKKEL